MYSTTILDTILHLSYVLLFSCFHNKILFEPMFCTLNFYVLCLKLGLPFHHVLVISFENPYVWVVFVHKNLQERKTKFCCFHIFSLLLRFGATNVVKTNFDIILISSYLLKFKFHFNILFLMLSCSFKIFTFCYFLVIPNRHFFFYTIDDVTYLFSQDLFLQFVSFST
jgi:hypothetical protein